MFYNHIFEICGLSQKPYSRERCFLFVDAVNYYIRTLEDAYLIVTWSSFTALINLAVARSDFANRNSINHRLDGKSVRASQTLMDMAIDYTA